MRAPAASAPTATTAQPTSSTLFSPVTKLTVAGYASSGRAAATRVPVAATAEARSCPCGQMDAVSEVEIRR